MNQVQTKTQQEDFRQKRLLAASNTYVPTIKVASFATAQGLAPFPYQRETVAQLINATHLHNIPYNYLAFDQGTGKTPISLIYANSISAKNVLIVCPASLRLNWLREAALWYETVPNFGAAILAGKDLREIYKNQNFKKTSPEANFYPTPFIVSYNMLTTNNHLYDYIRNRNWDLMILDEAQAIRTLNSKQTQHVLSLWNTFKDQKSPIFRVLMLSGTPLMNAATDLFPPLYFTLTTPHITSVLPEKDYNYTRDYHAYASRFTHSITTSWATVYKGTRNHDHLKRILKPHAYEQKPDNFSESQKRATPLTNIQFFFRKTKEEVLPDLPPKLYTRVDLNLDLTADQKTELSKMKILSSAAKQDELFSAFDHSLNAFNNLAKNNPELMRLRRLLGEAKAASPITFEFIQNTLIGSEGKCLVIFAHHKNTIKLLTDYLLHAKIKEKKISILTGDTSPTGKEQAVKDFQAGKTDIFIGSVTAASYGITLTRAQDVIFLEYDWLPTINEQAADRLHRVGQLGTVNVHFLVAQNVFEKRLLTEMIRKMKSIKRVV